MAERPRKVAEKVPTARVDLFGQESDIVRVRGGDLEDSPSGVELAGERLRVGEQERGEDERPFGALEAVIPAIFGRSTHAGR